MKYIENYSKNYALKEEEAKTDEEEIVFFPVQNDSELMVPQVGRDHLGNHGSLIGDDEFCYSIDKSRCKSIQSKDLKSA